MSLGQLSRALTLTLATCACLAQLGCGEGEKKGEPKVEGKENLRLKPLDPPGGAPKQKVKAGEGPQ